MDELRISVNRLGSVLHVSKLTEDRADPPYPRNSMKIRAVQLVVGKTCPPTDKRSWMRSQADPGDWVIFPEAIASGYYPHEAKYTEALDWLELADSLGDICDYEAKR